MGRARRVVFPRAQERLTDLGARLRAARLRRHVSQTEMAARVGASRTTIIRLEHGDPNIALGVLARVLGVLGLEADLDQLAANDEIGRRLQDLQLPATRERTRRQTP